MPRNNSQFLPDKTAVRLVGQHLGVQMPTDPHGQSLITVKGGGQRLGDYHFSYYTYGVVSVASDGTVPKRSGYGLTDDCTYQMYPDLQRLVPRCYSVVQIQHHQYPDGLFRIRGFNKFFGNTEVDNDDTVETASMMPSSSSESGRPKFDSVIVTQKVNGKATVLTVFEYGGQTWICGGSKTRHRAIRLDHAEQDLETLAGVDKMLVEPMLRDFYQTYRSFEPWGERGLRYRTQLMDRLIGRTTHPHTLCGEWKDGRHLVPLVGDEQPHTVWFGLLRCDPDFASEQSLTGDIYTNLRWLQNLFHSSGVTCREGEKVVSYWEISSKMVFESWYDAHRVKTYTEGSVLHYRLDGETVQIQKWKTPWYVLIRMLREVIRGATRGGGRNANGTERLARTYRTRIRERILQRNTWLKLPPGMVAIWYRLLCDFVRWMLQEQIDPAGVGFDAERSCPGMGILWKDYMAVSPFGDPEVEFRAPGTRWATMTLDEAFPLPNRLLVVMQGIPGIGKNTVGEAAATQLNRGRRPDDPVATTLDQDRFLVEPYKLPQRRTGPRCLEELEGLMTDPSYASLQYIFLMRNNANPSQYSAYTRLARDCGWKTLAVTPTELLKPNGPESDALVKICTEAVASRTDHPMNVLTPDPKSRQQVVDFFRGSFVPATVAGGLDLVSKISWCDQTANRRPVSEITTELVQLVEHHRTRDPEPLYISLPLPTSAELKSKLREQMPEMSDSSKVVEYMEHVTLCYSDRIHSHSALWEQLQQMRGRRIRCRVGEIHGFFSQTSRECDTEINAVTATVHLTDAETGENLAHLAASGYPHLTCYMPKGRQPAYSLMLLRGLGDEFIPVSTTSPDTLEWVSEVTLISKRMG